MNNRYVHLTPRLLAALSMLSGSKVVADVGCDHGRLIAALLQQGICEKVIATDISEPSLLKAKQLLSYIGLSEHVSFRAGDGLYVLKPGECDAIAILGMGGTLMTRILDRCETPINGACCVVLQPMRAQADIRSYLYAHNFWITDDRIVPEHGRQYQIFRAEPNTVPQPIPDGFPKDFFDVGYQSFTQHDPYLKDLCEFQLAQHRKRMKTATGTDGEQKLVSRMQALEQILKLITETNR